MKKLFFATVGIILVAVLGRAGWAYYQVKFNQTKTPPSPIIITTTTPELVQNNFTIATSTTPDLIVSSTTKSVLSSQSKIPSLWKEVVTNQFSAAFPDYPLYTENDMAGAVIIYPYVSKGSIVLKKETYTVSPGYNSTEGVYSTYGYGLTVTTYVSALTNPDSYIKELAKEQFSLQQNDITNTKATGTGSYHEYDYSFQKSQGIDFESPQGVGLNMYGKGKIIIAGKTTYELAAFYQGGKKDTKKDTDLKTFVDSFVLNNSSSTGRDNSILFAQHNSSAGFSKKISSDKFKISFPDNPLHKKTKLIGGGTIPTQKAKKGEITTGFTTPNVMSHEIYSFDLFMSPAFFSSGQSNSEDSSIYNKYTFSIITFDDPILYPTDFMKNSIENPSTAQYIIYSNIVDSAGKHELSYEVKIPQEKAGTSSMNMGIGNKGKIVLFGNTEYIIDFSFHYNNSQEKTTADTTATNFINSFSLK